MYAVSIVHAVDLVVLYVKSPDILVFWKSSWDEPGSLKMMTQLVVFLPILNVGSNMSIYNSLRMMQMSIFLSTSFLMVWFFGEFGFSGPRDVLSYMRRL